MLQAAARHAGFLQRGALPCLTLQVTNLTSFSGPANSGGNQGRSWQSSSGGGALAAASGPGGTSGWAAATLGLSGSSSISSGLQHQQQRHLLWHSVQQPELLLPQQQLWLTQQHQQPRGQQSQRQRQLPSTQRRPFFNFAGFGGDLSKSYQEKKLLGWTPRQVYDVVAAVEHYGKFVPWCQTSTIVKRQPGGGYLEAELEIGFQMFVERYTSKVTLHCPTAVHSRVDDSSLFSHLTNKWEFRQGPTPLTTWLTFEVDFAFKSPLYRQVASIFFEEVVQRMIGAFEARCAQLYGPSSLQRRPGPAQHASASGR